MSIWIQLCVLLCTVNANAAALSHLTRRLQDAPYGEEGALPTVKPLPRQEGGRVGGAEVEVVAGGSGATGLGVALEGGCQPGAAVSRSLLATRREPSFVREAKLRGAGAGQHRRTLADEGFRLPSMEEATSIREACTAPLQNASRVPWSGEMEVFSAELWAEKTLQLVKSPELRAFLESNNKYFYDKNHHVDMRFGAFPVDLAYARERLKLVLAAFMRFCDARDLHPWLAHVSLLGLTWNQRIPEYDDDLDMHMTFQDLKALHQWDQTVLEGQFLLDVNPHFVYRQIRENDANIIDARVVDIRSGVFIDITALSSVSPALGVRRVSCKSPHFYDVDWLFPLRRAIMEETEVWIPADVSKVLGSEYKMNGYSAGPFKGYYFNVVNRTWQKGRPQLALAG